MEVRLSELFKLQKPVSASADQLIVGFNIKTFNFLDILGYWRWDIKEFSVKRNELIDSLVDVLDIFTKLLLNTQYSNPVKDVLNGYEEEIVNTFEGLKKVQKEAPIEQFDLIKNWTVLIGTDNETGNTITTMQRMTIILFISETLFWDLEWEEIIYAYKNKQIN